MPLRVLRMQLPWVVGPLGAHEKDTSAVEANPVTGASVDPLLVKWRSEARTSEGAISAEVTGCGVTIRPSEAPMEKRLAVVQENGADCEGRARR